jgi:hypothetical protein
MFRFIAFLKSDLKMSLEAIIFLGAL